MATNFDQNDITEAEYSIHPGLEVFTLYNSSEMSLMQLLSNMLGSTAGIQIDSASLNYIGAERAISYFDSVALAPGIGLTTSGLLLTSGDGAPALSNTHEAYTVDNSNSVWVEYDEPQLVISEYEDEYGNTHTEKVWYEGYWETFYNGDEQFTNIVKTAFDGAGETNDASILEFSFTVTDSAIRSISLDLMFGSEEYPVFVDSSFVDIAAVIVNDRNYAYIDGDVTKPLSIIGTTVEDGRFIDNIQGEPSLAIEYNGITPKLTISIPLEEEQNTYNVRIGIADTGDHAYDSGLFVSNLQTLTSQYEGTLVNVEASDEGSILEAAAPGTATKFIGGKGNDIMKGSTAPDVYDLQSGGENIIQGKLTNLDNDTVIGFSTKDTLIVDEAEFTSDQLKVTMGSAILDIELNEQESGTVKLEGDYRKGVFITSSNETGTDVRFQAFDLEPDSIHVVTADDKAITIATGGLVKLLGDTAGKNITVEKGSGVINVAAGTHITLEGIEQDDIQLLRDGTTLLIVDKEGNTLVQMASSTTTNLEEVSTLILGENKFALVADVTIEALGLFDLLQSEELPSGMFFGSDGDRFMGSKWQQGEILGIDLAELTGIQTDMESLF